MLLPTMWQTLQRRPLTTYLLYRTLALTWAFAPFQVYYLQRKGLSVADVFDLNVVFCIAAVAFEVPTGMFADRNGRRVAMSWGGFVMSGACALFVFGESFSAFAFANVLCALSMALSSGADSAYLYDHLVQERRSSSYARWEGWSTAAKGLGNLAAVLIGAAIYQWIHPAGVFVFTAALTAIAGVIARALPERPGRNDGYLEDHLRRAMRTLRTDPRLMTVVSFGAMSFVLLRLSLFADQPHIESHLHGAWVDRTVLSMGALAAAKEVATIIVASGTGALLARLRHRTIAITLALALIAGYAVMGENRAVPCIAIMVLVASAFGLFSPLMRALMNSLITSTRDRATLLSFEGMGRRLLFAVVSPLFGRAVEASSLHATFTGTAWVAGISYASLAVVALLAFRLGATSSPPAAVRSGSLASATG